MHRLILFAKIPRLGRVKTRLVPPLSPEQALGLYRAFLLDQIEFLDSFADGKEIELCLDAPWRPQPGGAGLPAGLRLTEQGDGDLGMRMLRAFRRSRSEGVTATVVLGADAPTLPRSRIDEALESLDAGQPAVVVPAADGGYVLLGLREPRPDLFHGVPWGGADVLSATRARAEESGIELFLLPGWYDVDDHAALERLKQDLETPWGAERAPRTARCFLDLRRTGVV
jgi:rSAM/selenodomain-associated transferase 1